MKRIITTILAMAILITPHLALAAPDGLDWPYYTHEDQDNTEQLNAESPPGGGGGAAASEAGCNGAQTVYNFLKAQREGSAPAFSEVQIAGILGNFEIESRFNPTIVNPRSGAYGLAQWLGGRLTNLRAKANYTTLEVQQAFVWEELKGSEGRAYTQIRSVGGSDIEAARRAADNWLTYYERAPGQLVQERRDAAAAMFNRISSGQWCS